MINGIESCREVEKTKTGYLLWAYSINKMIVNVEQSSLGGVLVNVGRLVGIEEIIGSKVFSESRFNNTFNDFRDERKIRNRTIVWELFLVKVRFFKQRRYWRLLKSRMELARAERQIDYVGNSVNEHWSTFLEKPGWDRIRIRLFVRLDRNCPSWSRAVSLLPVYVY